MWIRLTPDDIERAKEQLAARRAEILARHADEIQGLDADEAQIDELAGLAEAFMRRFKDAAPAPAILTPRPRESPGYRQAASLAVAGFDRAVLSPDLDPRLTPSGAVSIDFHRSRNKSATGG
jgi:hypothetical protein